MQSQDGPNAPAPGAALDRQPGARSLAGAVRTVGLLTLLSRFGGLAREVLMARIFGVSAVASAFAAGFAIPNMFRRLFGEGALSAAFIPEYTQAQKSDPEGAARLASLTIAALLAVTTALTVCIEGALLVVLWALPPDPERTLSLQLIMLMLPYMPLVCAAAVLGGMLQVHGRFAPAASGPIILNGFIIAVGAYFLLTGQSGGRTTAMVLGGVTVLSGVTQCAWYFRLLRPHVRWTRVFAGAGHRVGRVLKRFVPVLIGMGTLQLNGFIDTLIAMWPIWVGPTILGAAYPLDEQSNAIVTYAQRLYQFPLGVFGIAVATAVFPMLARHADEPGHFVQTLRRGLRLSLFIGLPASAGLILVRHDLTAVLYSGGRTGLGGADLERCAAVLLGFAPAIWAYSLNHVFTRAFYARGDTATPMRVALGMVALNFALNWALIWPLREAGLAWSTSIAATAQCAVLGLLTRRSLGASLRDAPSGGAVVRIAACTGAMAAAVGLALWLMPFATTWPMHLLRLGTGCAVGVLVYLLSAAASGSHEVRWLLARGQTEGPS